MFLYDDKPLTLDVPFEIKGVQYSAHWLRFSSLEEKEAIGIVEVLDPVRPDDQFYWIDNNNIGTPKDLDKLKDQWNKRVNQITNTFLASSDWMITRKMETGEEISNEWAGYRNQIRIDSKNNKELINNAPDFDTFVSIVTNLQWAKSPDDVGI
jgi:hypothetical protein